MQEDDPVLRQHSRSELVVAGRSMPQMQNQNFGKIHPGRAANGTMFLVCYYYFGFNLSLLKYATFSFLLIGLIFTDAETKLLPDKLTLTGLGIGLAFSFLVPVNDLASQVLPGRSQFAR